MKLLIKEKGGAKMSYYNNILVYLRNSIFIYPKFKTDDGLEEYKKLESKYYRKNGKMYRSEECY